MKKAKKKKAGKTKKSAVKKSGKKKAGAKQKAVQKSAKGKSGKEVKKKKTVKQATSAVSVSSVVQKVKEEWGNSYIQEDEEKPKEEENFFPDEPEPLKLENLNDPVLGEEETTGEDEDDFSGEETRF